VQKSYQRGAASASAEVVVPDEVTIGLTEIAASAKEGLLALAVGTGLQVMEAMFAEDTDCLCAPKSKHNAKRSGYRHGSEAGSVTLGGRRLRGQRPRVRATNASAELFLPSYALFSSTEVLGRLAMERMLLRPLGAPLPGRPGAGWQRGRGSRDGDEPVGRLAPLHPCHRERPR